MYQTVISVIVPVYKVEPYLRKCLDSIVGQTYPNLEIILVDDESPDRCGEICDEYAAKDPRVRVIHQKKIGVSAARNAGLDLAGGDYLMFVDSDDWLERDACETVLAIAQAQGADMVCYGYNEVKPSGVTPRLVCASSDVVEKETFLKNIIWGRSLIRDYCWNKFVARKLYDGIRFPKGRVYEDVGTVYKTVHRAEKIYMTDQVLYNYLTRKGSITSTPFLMYQVEDRIWILKERLAFLEANYPELADLQLFMLIRELIVCRDRLEWRADKRAINEELKRTVEAYRSRMPVMAKFSKVIWVYCYCPFLLTPFLRVRRFMGKM